MTQVSEMDRTLAEIGYEQRTVPLAELRPPKRNPRQTWNADELDELVEDIRAHGLLENIIVRPTSDAGVYEVVAGERRRRACEKLGLTQVPVSIVRRPISDAQALEIAISENLRRSNLDPIETANAYATLAEETGRTQAEIGAMVGRSQPVIANTMRLLKLPERVQKQIRDGELTTAHGIQLTRFSEWPEIAQAVADLAIEHHTIAHDLEQPLPFSKALIKAGLVHEVPSDLPFARALINDRANYVKSAPGSSFGWYLNPARFAELKAKADDDARKKREAALSASRGQTAPTPAADGQSQTVERKPRNPAAKLPMLTDLAPGTFLQVDNYRPAGCSADVCTCAGRAFLSDGATITEICTDRKRFARLQKAEEVRAGKFVARQKSAVDDWLTANLKDVDLASGRTFVAAFFRDVQWFSTPWEKALTDCGIELPDGPTDSDEFRDWLAGLGIDALARLAFAASLRCEINTDADLTVTAWYLGDDLPVPAPEPEKPDKGAGATENGSNGADGPEGVTDGEGAPEGLSVAQNGNGEHPANGTAGEEWPPADHSSEANNPNGARRKGRVAAGA